MHVHPRQAPLFPTGNDVLQLVAVDVGESHAVGAARRTVDDMNGPGLTAIALPGRGRSPQRYA
jgi:hypothetical protein